MYYTVNVYNYDEMIMLEVCDDIAEAMQAVTEIVGYELAQRRGKLNKVTICENIDGNVIATINC